MSGKVLFAQVNFTTLPAIKIGTDSDTRAIYGDEFLTLGNSVNAPLYHIW